MSNDPVLPVSIVLPEIANRLKQGRNLVISAPPGAGKSTEVPVFLAREVFPGGRIVMLEPRRAAARLLARRIGAISGLPTGYRVRHENTVHADTRIEIVTEGMFPAMLRRDMALSGVSAVIFDEFHERNLDTDLALALALEVQDNLRGDLALIAMSATLDAAPLCKILGGAPLVESSGRMHPVETVYADRSLDRRDSGRECARACLRMAAKHPGGILAFLPGAGEVDRCAALLEEAVTDDIDVCRLYGALSSAAQDRALAPAAPGRRKIVVSTNLAESSVTIPDVRIVVDTGLARRSVFDPGAGFSHLETVMISQAGADQRRGRAGRCDSGVCLRLFTEGDARTLAPFTAPEITGCDLAAAALTLADWGTPAEKLRWLDPPPAGALAGARELLRELGALDETGAITAFGRRLAAFPAHPRLGAMLLRSGGSERQLAAELAALLELRSSNSGDLRSCLEDARWHPPFGFVQSRDQLLRMVGGGFGGVAPDAARAGEVVARAFPEWIGRRREGSTREYLLSGGRGVVLPENSPLENAEFLACARLDGAGAHARILAAAPVERTFLEAEFPQWFHTRTKLFFDEGRRIVSGRSERCFGEIVLSGAPLEKLDPEATARLLADAVKSFGGIPLLELSKSAELLRRRMIFARESGCGLPDVSDAALLELLPGLLTRFAPEVRSFAELRRLDWVALLGNLLDYPARQELDRTAPEYFTIPATGRKLKIDYAQQIPTVASRIQDFYGCDRHPTAGRNLPLRVELLNPAQRPVQITLDLPGFWRGSWALVRKELRGRYPKHDWPEEPWNAVPGKGLKKEVRRG